MIYPKGFDIQYEKETSRELVWFTKKREILAGREKFTTLTIFQLREFFNVTDSFWKDPSKPYDPSYDPYMVDCYRVNELHAKFLQPYIKHKIKLDKYDYFIEAYACSK